MLKSNHIIGLERELVIVGVVVVEAIVGAYAPRLVRLHAVQIGQGVQVALGVRVRALGEPVLFHVFEI
jgi:hypothetical protein